MKRISSGAQALAVVWDLIYLRTVVSCRYLYLFPLQVRRKKEQGAVRMEAEAETETETETETKTETADATRWFPHLGVGPPSGKADTLEDNFEIDVDVDHINTLLHR